MQTKHLLKPSSIVSFADVAHQMVNFDANQSATALVLELIDTKWMQRLRRIRQTGNTHLVYMFAEHSRFGHSLGVAYLANSLMQNLAKQDSDQILPYQEAVSAAALLHDIGHIAPGSHLAEQLWCPSGQNKHEMLSTRVILEDAEVNAILRKYNDKLPELVTRILKSDDSLPPWTYSVISGGGWNADRGNWAIVDSAMCSVSYGRYNVAALVDAFRLSPDGHLVIQESRLDALTHFFVARDSMYRQVYQHRVLQAADALNKNIVVRLRDLIEKAGAKTPAEVQQALSKLSIKCDEAMAQILLTEKYAKNLSLDTLFSMTEGWWQYHLEHWCDGKDEILADLAARLRDRRLFKTVRLDDKNEIAQATASSVELNKELHKKAFEIAQELALDPRYYVTLIDNRDHHRENQEEAPLVLLDNGKIVSAETVEPMIAKILERSSAGRAWLAVPKEIKEKLGRYR